MTDPVQGNNDQFLLKVCKGALHRITWAVVGFAVVKNRF